MSFDIRVRMASMQQTDKDELFVCPYDNAHRVSAKRFIRHILKCGKNHPSKDKIPCPFNARHIVDKPELQSHITACPDKRLLENEINYERLAMEQNELKGDTSIPPYSSVNVDFGDGEDWEKEINQNGRKQCSLQQQRTSREKRADMDGHKGEAIKRIEKLNKQAAFGNSLPGTEQRRPVSKPKSVSTYGIGRGRNLERSSQAAQVARQSNIPLRSPRLAANFHMRLPSEHDAAVTGSSGRGRRPVQGPLFVENKFNHVVVDDVIDTEIERSIQAITCSSDGYDGGDETYSSRAPPIASPIEVLKKERQKLNKLLKQVRHLEMRAEQGLQLNPDEIAKLGKRSKVERRLLEIKSKLIDC